MYYVCSDNRKSLKARRLGLWRDHKALSKAGALGDKGTVTCGKYVLAYYSKYQKVPNLIPSAT